MNKFEPSYIEAKRIGKLEEIIIALENIKKIMPVIVEICCTSYQSALNAKYAGADRIELCDNYFEGGTTPSAGLVKNISEKIGIKMNVLIRPRGGDFLYSEDEFETMKEDISILKELGAEGFVLGLLKEDGTIDIERTRELVVHAEPFPVTFHRAFDMTPDPVQSLQDVIETGARRLLTSGMSTTAIEGKMLIKKLVELKGDEIIIMAGGGLRKNNIKRFLADTHVKEIHLSARKMIKSNMKFVKTNVVLSGNFQAGDYHDFVSEKGEIEELIQILNGYG